MSFLYAQSSLSLLLLQDASNTHRGVEALVVEGTKADSSQISLKGQVVEEGHHEEKEDEEDEYDFHDHEPIVPSLILSKILHL